MTVSVAVQFSLFSFSQVRRHPCLSASLRFFERFHSFHPDHHFFRLPHLITLAILRDCLPIQKY